MRLRLAVILIQLTAFLVYVHYLFTTETAPAFSTEDWLFVLVPTCVFASLFGLGMLVLLRPRPAATGVVLWTGIVSSVATAVVMVGTVLLIPLWVYGNLTDI